MVGLRRKMDQIRGDVGEKAFMHREVCNYESAMFFV